MKKILVLTVVFVMAIGTAAFARGYGHGNGNGFGHGGHGGCGFSNNDGTAFNCPNGAGANCPNGGMGMGMGGMGMGMGQDGNAQAPAATVKTEKEAEALVQSYLNTNYKGYKIAKSESFAAPRGTAYKVTVNDASGNTFIFHVNPWGNVRGPFLNK